MKSDNELPESAKRAFGEYPHLEPSSAFNRAVLESLQQARLERRQTLVGRLEEFLGLGLWQFAGSGVLGALFPAVVLTGLLLSGHTPQTHKLPPSNSMTWPGISPFNEVTRREYQWV